MEIILGNNDFLFHCTCKYSYCLTAVLVTVVDRHSKWNVWRLWSLLVVCWTTCHECSTCFCWLAHRLPSAGKALTVDADERDTLHSCCSPSNVKQCTCCAKLTFLNQIPTNRKETQTKTDFSHVFSRHHHNPRTRQRCRGLIAWSFDSCSSDKMYVPFVCLVLGNKHTMQRCLLWEYEPESFPVWRVFFCWILWWTALHVRNY